MDTGEIIVVCNVVSVTVLLYLISEKNQDIM